VVQKLNNMFGNIIYHFMKAKFTSFGTMKKVSLMLGLYVFVIVVFLLQSCAVYTTQRRTTIVETIPPPPPPPAPIPPVWAPPYDDVQQVRYYYIPDLEVYYDVWSHEYVYLDDGQWIFSAYLPPFYSSYDINNAWVVVLDYRVYQPWKSHHQYISHYPRYYYRHPNNNHTTVINNTTIINNYGDDELKDKRGYNENAKKVIYRDNRRVSPNENNENTPNRRNSSYEKVNTNENKRVERKNENNDRNNGNTERKKSENTPPPDVKENNPTDNSQGVTNRRSQPAVYNGKEIGKPVKVTKSMRQPKENTNTKSTNKSTEQNDKTKDNSQTPNRRR
jgi:hypothetical protein